MIRIVPQIYKTYSGERFISYATWKGFEFKDKFYAVVFLGYAKCFCAAKKAVEMIQE